MIDSISEMVNKKCIELAKKHAEIIESECKLICEKFNCAPSDLELEYNDKMQITIKINASRLVVEHKFIVKDV